MDCHGKTIALWRNLESFDHGTGALIANTNYQGVFVLEASMGGGRRDAVEERREGLKSGIDGFACDRLRLLRGFEWDLIVGAIADAGHERGPELMCDLKPTGVRVGR
jgi:hypothetical protein